MSREGACRSLPGVQTKSQVEADTHAMGEGAGGEPGKAQPRSCRQVHVLGSTSSSWGQDPTPGGRGARWGDVGRLSSSQAGSKGGQGAKGRPLGGAASHSPLCPAV